MRMAAQPFQGTTEQKATRWLTLLSATRSNASFAPRMTPINFYAGDLCMMRLRSGESIRSSRSGASAPDWAGKSRKHNANMPKSRYD